jgi:hemerythrin-like domain-containing protein
MPAAGLPCAFRPALPGLGFLQIAEDRGAVRHGRLPFPPVSLAHPLARVLLEEATMPRTNGNRRKAPNAIAILTEDHKKVQKIFDQFEHARDDRRKGEMVTTALHDLTVHTQLEEEIFYPAVRRAIGEDELMDEATVEHASAKQLISDLEGMDPGDELFEAKFTVLGEYVKHHIKEEQREMFPRARRAKVDLAELGEQMLQRKEELA